MSLLNEILTNHATTVPTGTPLYRYKLTADQRAGLRATLSQHCERSMSLTGSTAALFCLYAADRLRNHAGSGVWTWASVTDAIGWRGPDSELRDAVRRGLQWWRRPLFITAKGRHFLATLVTEGGGPLGLLRDPNTGATLRTFLRRLLVDRERFQRPALELVGAHRTLLGLALQRDTVLEVFASLVDHVAALRVKLRELGTTSADPVQTLDQRDPGWRDRFALDLHDGVASELLKGLLREPSQAASTARTVPTIETRLEGDNPVSLLREVVLPSQPNAKAFLEAFGCSIDPPGRVRILLEWADGTRVAVATAVARLGGEATYAFERSGGTRIDDPALVREAVTLIAMAGSRELGRMHPPGGEALEQDPWIFSGDDRRRLLGTSSLRTRHPSVVVAWRTDGVRADSSSTESWRELGALDLPGERRALHAMSGTLRLHRGADEDVISTSDAIEDDWWYLQGRQWSGPGRIAGTVYLGVPAVRGLDTEGFSHVLPSASLTWRREGAPAVAALGTCLGRGTLELRRQGRTVLRTAVTLLPADLVVETRASLQPDEGTIRVRSASLLDVGVDPANGLDVSVDRTSDTITLRLRRSTQDVQSVGLTLRLRGAGDVSLRVDFPARRSGFVRGFDVMLPPDSRCSLDRLAQLRAVARSHNPADRFELQARVQGVTRWMVLATLAESGGRRELVLDTVADDLSALLAQTHEIDGVVQVVIVCSAGQQGPRKVLSVGRHDRSLDLVRDEEGCTLTLRQSAAAMQYPAESIRLEARPLLEPQADPVVLEPADGRWRFTFAAFAAFAPGPWMLLGWRDDRLALRPLLITVAPRDGAVPDAPTGLRAAASRAPADSRFEALARCFDEMVRDPYDLDWHLVDDHVATLQALPAATFDLIRALVRSEEAAIIALLRAPAPMRACIWNSFETLPLLWETIPVTAWARALGRIRDRWSTDARTLDPRGFGPWFEELTAFVDSRGRMARVQLEIAAAADDLPLASSTLELAHGNPMFCAMLLESLKSDVLALRARHDGEEWPYQNISALLESLPRSERLQGHEDSQELVIHAPLLAAALSAGRSFAAGEDEETSPLVGLQMALRRARSFDPAWFDEAAASWLARLMICNG